MQHTLVAVFDKRSDAQQALDDLVASGFERQAVRLNQGEPADQAGQGVDTAAAGDQGMGASIMHFFSDLFGTDRSEHAKMYSDAVGRGHFVLTLTADSEAEVERGADIVERYGPIDIDEQAQEWQTAGLHPGAAAQQQSAAMSQQFAPGAAAGALDGGTGAFTQGQGQGQGPSQGSGQGSMQGGSLQGAQQRSDTAAIPVIQEELKVGKREVQRGGVRVYQRLVETPVTETVGLREEHVNVQRRAVDKLVDPADIAAFQDTTIELRETAEEPVIEKSARVVEEVIVGKEVTQREQQISDTLRRTEVEVEQLMPDDDAYYRGHWTSNFAGQGSYEDYAPAYSYGNTMARSDLYRGRPWDDVEGNLKTDWEARNPGSTWEKIKSAVRHGWERMTS